MTSIPFNVTFTSGKRSGEKAGEHSEGKSVDLADNDEGLKFYNWIVSNSPEAQAWKRANNFDYIMYHENDPDISANKSGFHYHVKFR